MLRRQGAPGTMGKRGLSPGGLERPHRFAGALLVGPRDEGEPLLDAALPARGQPGRLQRARLDELAVLEEERRFPPALDEDVGDL